MNKGVLYYVTGDRHWPVLTVSLMSLRRVYNGPVAMMVGDDAGYEIYDLIAQDARLGPIILLDMREEQTTYGRNTGYMNKPKMVRLSPFDSTIFIDADTLICGDIEPLFIHPDGEFRLTKFGNWTTKTKRVAGRIAKWRDVDPDMVDGLLSTELPAINTGVLAFGSGWKSQEFGMDWEITTDMNPSFIADEIAAQIIFLKHHHQVLDDRWNCSPVYGQNKDVAIIWHFHGKKHLREEAKPIWLPRFQEACDLNLASIKDWLPAGDKTLAEYLEAT